MRPRRASKTIHAALLATGLIRWDWNPGARARGGVRTTSPVSYSEFIGLTRGWIESGVTCPR